MADQRESMSLVRFDAFVEQRLYAEGHGFYAEHGSAGGARGDFITSPEVGPLFGAVIGRYLDQRWRDLAQPDEFRVVEVGAGKGTLAAAILASAPDCLSALNYQLVERSEQQLEQARSLLGDRAEYSRNLDESSSPGVVLANELLDNLPFRVIVRRGSEFHEWFVEDGTAIVEYPAVVEVGDWPGKLPEGVAFPWHEQAARWIAVARSAIGTGAVLAFDYGVSQTADLVGRAWLRTYRNHRRGADPLVSASVDITTDVGFDQLAPDRLRTQSEFLESYGIQELVAEGRRIWAEGAAQGSLAAIAGRSRVTEAEALLDVDGLGGFLVAEWRVG